MKDSPPLDSLRNLDSYPEKNNFKEWLSLMDWQKSGDISNTMYLLTYLKEITYGKDSFNFKSKNVSSAQKQAMLSEKESRDAVQDQLIMKGGFYFLLYMFGKINKQCDFESEIIVSKTL